MNHVELHNRMSKMLDKLETGKVGHQFAKEFFNGAGKIISNCKNELVAINMGLPLDVPLLGVKKGESLKLT